MLVRKNLAILLVTAAIPFYAIGVTHAGNSKSFPDIEGHWAKDSVLAATEKGFIDGYEDGTFRPEQSVTRAEFVKMLLTGLDFQKKDVPGASEWYRPYLEGAAQAGIYRDGDFRGDLNEPISRLEMSQLSLRGSDESLRNGYYLDDKSAMYQSTKRGLIQGLSGGELAPDGLTTRAQAVTIIDRAQKLKKGDTLPNDKAATSRAEIEATNSNLRTMIGKPSAVFPVDATWKNAPVKATLQKAIVIDNTNQDDPFYYMIKDTKADANVHDETGEFSYGDTHPLYVLALLIDFEIPEGLSGRAMLNNYYDMVRTMPVIGRNYGQASLDLTKPGVTSQYIMFAYDKKQVDSVELAKYFRLQVEGKSSVEISIK